ncbi:hypothetical protein [Campylobacter sp. RM16192]|uniref:hypothetical protein n=1 Tax=Campylobacter sp. RM16192 TaxID=1660080 RepID=UPI001452233C|nr:hypothetical protein [Campylobacter sp. RM16192]QCD52805.1 hypothetical protein CDOMC_1198 [Campylobacter sp. RM16192]
MRFDFNGQDEITIGYKDRQPIRLRASGQNVFKNENGGLSIDIDEDKLQGIKLSDKFSKTSNSITPYPSAPKAPAWQEPQKKDESFLDGLVYEAKRLGNDIKRTASSVWEDSIFGDYGTGASTEDKARSDIARAQNTQGLIKSIVQSDESKQANNERLADTYEKLAQERGFDLGAIVRDGKIYFGKTGDNGKPLVTDVTPNFTNQISANKGEIVGATIGAFLPGGIPLKIAGSALGSAGGAGVDYANRAENLGENIDTQALLMRMGEAAVDDLAAGALVGAGAKVAKPTIDFTAKYGGKALDLAGKASDFGILGVMKDTLKGVPSANVGGAKKVMQTIAGDEADLMLQNSQKVGGYKVDNNNFTDIQVLNKPVNFMRKHLAGTADKLKLDKVSDFINNAKGVNDIQKEIVDLSLADSKATGRVINALRGDTTGKAAQNLAELAQSDVNAIREILPDAGKGDLGQTIKSYYARVGDDFKKMEEDIGEFLGGKTSTLDSNAIDEAKQAMIRGLNKFDAKTPEAAQLLDVLDGLKNTPMTFQDLRALKVDFNEYAQKIFNKNPAYNTIIDTSSVGRVIDNAIDNLISGTPTKEYYKNTLAKYSAMKALQDNPLFKTTIDGNASTKEVLDAIFSAEKAQGDILKAFTKELNKKELAKFETDLLSSLFQSQIAKRGKLKQTELIDGIGLKEDLEKIQLRSPEAQEIKEAMINLANARGDFAVIFRNLEKEFIDPIRPRAGIAQKVEGVLRSVLMNRLKQSIFKYIGKIGNDSAFEYHLREGLKALKVEHTLEAFEKAVKASGASDEITDGFVKGLQDVIKERQKEALHSAKGMRWSSVAPENSKQTAIKPKEPEFVKGDNFTMSKEGELKTQNTKTQNTKTQNTKTQKNENKEKRGIYNVMINGKVSSAISYDLDALDRAIQLHRGSRKMGAKHIEIRHGTDPNKEGYVSTQEVVNLGRKIREFLAKHKKPFADNKGRHLYEWSEYGVNFRAVISNKNTGKPDNNGLAHLPDNDIITFYSDRNFKEPMKFKNPDIGSSDDKKGHLAVGGAVGAGALSDTEELNLTDLDKKFIKAYPSVKESFLRNKLKAQRVEKLKKELLNPKTSWKRKTEIVNQIKKELV